MRARGDHFNLPATWSWPMGNQRQVPLRLKPRLPVQALGYRVWVNLQKTSTGMWIFTQVSKTQRMTESAGLGQWFGSICLACCFRDKGKASHVICSCSQVTVTVTTYARFEKKGWEEEFWHSVFQTRLYNTNTAVLGEKKKKECSDLAFPVASWPFILLKTNFMYNFLAPPSKALGTHTHTPRPNKSNTNQWEVPP